MARQKALYVWILGNANLWTGHRSLNVGHLAKPFFVANQKKVGWKQSISNLWMKTPLGLTTAKIAMASSQFKETDYTYPLYVYDISRADETDLDK